MGHKGYLASQTIWGAIIASIPLILIILQSFGVEVTQDEASAIIDHLDSIFASVIGIVGIVNVVIGRKNATAELRGLI